MLYILGKMDNLSLTYTKSMLGFFQICQIFRNFLASPEDESMCFQNVIYCILFAVTIETVQSHVSDIPHIPSLSKHYKVQHSESRHSLS
jgi:hypothetical protein